MANEETGMEKIARAYDAVIAGDARMEKSIQDLNSISPDSEQHKHAVERAHRDIHDSLEAARQFRDELIQETARMIQAVAKLEAAYAGVDTAYKAYLE